MFDELYSWLESYAGTSYDFSEAISEVDQQHAFIDPFNWRVSLEMVLDQLDDACDIIDRYCQALPTYLPNKKKLKRILSQDTLSRITGNIRGVCGMMNLTLDEISTIDQLKDVIETLYEFLDMMTSHDINDIIKHDLYQLHEEENNDSYSNILSVFKEDLPQIAMTINAIRSAYYDALDVEESMEDV